jgi:hypothetical protein
MGRSYTLGFDNGTRSGELYSVSPFELQLPGPFSFCVSAGLSPYPDSL